MNEIPSFRVRAKRCNQCLFSKNRIVPKSRMVEILEDCKRKSIHFVCHKSPDNKPIMCRGFYETQPEPSTLQIVRRFEAVGLGRIEFIEESDDGRVP